MFISIKEISNRYKDDSNGEIRCYIYELIDTNFSYQFTIEKSAMALDQNTAIMHLEVLGAIIAEYEKRELPILSNVVAFYVYAMQRQHGFWSYNSNPITINSIKGDVFWMDIIYPELEFGTKYGKRIEKMVLTSLMLSNE